MDIEKFVIRGITRYYQQKDTNAYDASRLVCQFEGENVMNYKLGKSRCSRFDKSNVATLDKPKSDRHRSLSLELIKLYQTQKMYEKIVTGT